MPRQDRVLGNGNICMLGSTKNVENYQTGCPQQIAASSTESGFNPRLTSEASSTLPWALDGIHLRPSTSPMNTNTGTPWSGISPTSTVDPRFQLTEQQQQWLQSESPRTAAANLQSPSATKSPVMTNNNIPAPMVVVMMRVSKQIQKAGYFPSKWLFSLM